MRRQIITKQNHEPRSTGEKCEKGVGNPLFACNHPPAGDKIAKTAILQAFVTACRIVVAGLCVLLILLSACVPNTPTGNVFPPETDAPVTAEPPSPTVTEAPPIADYAAQFDAAEVVFCDSYDGDALFAACLRRLPSYTIGQNYINKRSHFVLNVARYEPAWALWQEMTDSPILLSENTYFDSEHLTAAWSGTGELTVTRGETPIAALRFVGGQFVLHEYGETYASNEAVSDPNAALLLGLSGRSERSVYLYVEDSKLHTIEKPGAIFVPGEDGFACVSTLHEYRVTYNADHASGDDGRQYIGQRTYHDLLTYQAGTDALAAAAARAAEYETLFDWFGFDDSTDTLSYITNGYASYRNSYRWYGGGSGSSTTPNALFGPVREMNAQRYAAHEDTWDTFFTPGGTPLIDFLPEQKAAIVKKIEAVHRAYAPLETAAHRMDWLYDRGFQFYGISEDNLLLVHEAGKLKLKLAVEHWSYAPNGSPHGEYERFIDVDVPLPDSLTGGRTLCVDFADLELLFPGAIDAYSSPNGLLLAVELPEYILLFTRESAYDPFVYRSPIDVIYKTANERVVMAEWAHGDTVQAWRQVLEQAEAGRLYWLDAQTKRMIG